MMNSPLEQNLLPVSDLKLEDFYIDPMLHDFFAPDDYFETDFKIRTDDAAQKTSILDPHTPNSIHLSISDFKLPSYFTYFLYDDSEPQMVLYDDCIVCNAKMVPVSAATDQRGKEYLTEGLCPDCGFFQHMRRPPKEWYANFYRKQWDLGGRSESQAPQKIELRTDMLDQAYGFIKPGQRVLEIGAGWGAALLAFHRAGFEAYGIEATDHRSEFIRSKMGIPCFTGEGENIPIGKDFFIPESFDMIYSNHVLEHVYNAREVLEHVYCLLKKNGLAMLAIPNYYQENLTKNTHDMSHTCSFSHSNFYFMLQTIGFDLVKDFSNQVNLCMLVRKAPPLSAEQRQSKIDWMKTFLPHRGLAYILEKNGLARVPRGLAQDLSTHIKWYAHVWDQKICFVDLKYNVLRPFGKVIDQLKDAILQRRPLREVAGLLPVKYVYKSDGVPMWYY